MVIGQTVVELVKAYQAMNPADQDGPEGRRVVGQIEELGETAAFWGGRNGVAQLRRAAVSRDHTISAALGRILHRIGLE